MRFMSRGESGRTVGDREEQEQAERPLADLLIRMTPSDWAAIELAVTVTVAHGRLQMAHALSSPEGKLSPALIAGEDVFLLTKRLHEVFNAQRHPWSMCTMIVYYDGSNWAFRVNYSYPKE